LLDLLSRKVISYAVRHATIKELVLDAVL